MRLILLKKYSNELERRISIPVLCKRSVVKEVFSNDLKYLIDENIFSWDQRFIGLVKDKKEAFEKYPEYFI